MEYQPINESVVPNRKYKIFTIILSILFISSIVAISILAYELVMSKKGNEKQTVSLTD